MGREEVGVDGWVDKSHAMTDSQTASFPVLIVEQLG